MAAPLCLKWEYLHKNILIGLYQVYVCVGVFVCAHKQRSKNLQNGKDLDKHNLSR